MRPACVLLGVLAACSILPACDQSVPTTRSDPVTPVASQSNYRLATNDEPSEIGRGIVLTGQVQLKANGCVVIKSSAVLWPQGYTVTTDARGIVTVYNTNGAPVAQVGDTIDIGVTRAPVDDPCASASNGFVMIEDPPIIS